MTHKIGFDIHIVLSSVHCKIRLFGLLTPVNKDKKRKPNIDLFGEGLVELISCSPRSQPGRKPCCHATNKKSCYAAMPPRRHAAMPPATPPSWWRIYAPALPHAILAIYSPYSLLTPPRFAPTWLSLFLYVRRL